MSSPRWACQILVEGIERREGRTLRHGVAIFALPGVPLDGKVTTSTDEAGSYL